MLFFFFKQKTAYEMRISDWSSDVCSSDLLRYGRVLRQSPALRRHASPDRVHRHGNGHCVRPASIRDARASAAPRPRRRRRSRRQRLQPVVADLYAAQLRSEEHTSELQSLMRTSYAVFCLKKNTQTLNNKITPTNNQA